MYHIGDIVTLYLSLLPSNGSSPTVTTPPQVSVLRALDDAAMDVAGTGVKTVAMSLVTGTAALYKFNWPTSTMTNGAYAALVSYVANGITITNQLLSVILLGDSYLTGPVALASVTAKTTDVPPVSEVMLVSDFVAPSADTSIQEILAKVNTLPTSPADQATLLSVSAQMQDIHDGVLGSWSLNKDVNPNILTLYRLDGSVLDTYSFTNSSSIYSRTKE